MAVNFIVVNLQMLLMMILLIFKLFVPPPSLIMTIRGK